MLIAQLSTDDFETALAATQQLFPGFVATPGDVPTHFDITAHHAAGLTSIDYRASGLDAHFELQSSEGFGVGELELEGRLTTGRDALDPTRPFAIPQVMIADLVRVRSQVLQLDEAELARFARTDLGRDRFELHALGTAPMSPEGAAHWRSAAQLVRNGMRDGLADDPVIGASLQQLLMAAYLHAFPTSWSDARAPRDGNRAVPAAVRRAKRYMEEHAHEAITVTDVAEASGLSVRGLQAAFRRALGGSPADHLRRIRLDGARSDLLSADPLAGHSVSGIARRWGFAHLGRFSQTYKAEYGEHPSQTLRR